MVRLVGFVGPKGCGKDTASGFLQKANKINHKISFAGPMKRIITQVFGVPQINMDNLDQKERRQEKPFVLDRPNLRKILAEMPKYLSEIDPKTGGYLYNLNRVSIAGIENREFWTIRELLQFIGSELIRDRIYKDWHVRAAFSEKALSKTATNMVYSVTDIRFENEFDFLATTFKDSFIPYYIVNPEAEEVLEKATHQSELDILKVKAKVPEANHISNDGDLDDFKKVVLKLQLPGPMDKEVVKQQRKSKFVFKQG